ncbi:hypothetical protein GCM10027598_80880 [Amycolatopsis oliviviridis]
MSPGTRPPFAADDRVEVRPGGLEFADRFVDPVPLLSQRVDEFRAIRRQPAVLVEDAGQDLQDLRGVQPGPEQDPDPPHRRHVALAVHAIAARPPLRCQQALLLVVPQRALADTCPPREFPDPHPHPRLDSHVNVKV